MKTFTTIALLFVLLSGCAFAAKPGRCVDQQDNARVNEFFEFTLAAQTREWDNSCGDHIFLVGEPSYVFNNTMFREALLIENNGPTMRIKYARIGDRKWGLVSKTVVQPDHFDGVPLRFPEVGGN